MKDVKDSSVELYKILETQQGKNVSITKIVKYLYKQGTGVSIAAYKNVWHLVCQGQRQNLAVVPGK